MFTSTLYYIEPPKCAYPGTPKVLSGSPILANVPGLVSPQVARKLASVCSNWRKLIASDDRLKFIHGSIRDAEEYLSEREPQGICNGRAELRVLVTEELHQHGTAHTSLSRSMAKRLESLSISSHYASQAQIDDFFRDFASCSFEGLSYLKLYGCGQDPRTFDFPVMRCARNLTVLYLFEIPTMQYETPVFSQLMTFLEALPNLECLAMKDFGKEYPDLSQAPDETLPTPLRALRSLYLTEESALVIFFLYYVTLPNLERMVIEAYRESDLDDEPIADSWYQRRCDYQKLTDLHLAQLDRNAGRFLTTCDLPKLSHLVIEDNGLSLSDPLSSAWLGELSHFHAPRLRRLVMGTPMGRQKWIHKQLTLESGAGSPGSLVLFASPYRWKTNSNVAPDESDQIFDVLLPSALANVQSLTVVIKSNAVDNFDASSLDKIWFSFSGIAEIQIYTQLSEVKDLARFQFLTPTCEPKEDSPSSLQQPILLPQLQSLSLFLIMAHGSPKIRMANCAELKAFVQTRNSIGMRLKKLIFNCPVTPQALRVLRESVDEVLVDLDASGRLEGLLDWEFVPAVLQYW